MEFIEDGERAFSKHMENNRGMYGEPLIELCGDIADSAEQHMSDGLLFEDAMQKTEADLDILSLTSYQMLHVKRVLEQSWAHGECFDNWLDAAGFEIPQYYYDNFPGTSDNSTDEKVD